MIRRIVFYLVSSLLIIGSGSAPCLPNSCPNVVEDASGNANIPGKVGVGTTSPSASSALQVDSTTGDFVPPRETNAQMNAINAPLDGGVVYNTDTKAFEGRVNGAWLPFVMEGFQIYADVKAQGTQGGTATTGAWTARTLNTAVMGDLDGVYTSLSNNQITIQPGKYYVDCTAPFYNTDRSMLRIQDITNAKTIQTGPSIYAGAAAAEIPVTVWAFLILSSATTYELDYYCKTGANADNLGLEFNVAGVNEMYAVCKIFKWA